MMQLQRAGVSVLFARSDSCYFDLAAGARAASKRAAIKAWAQS